MAALPSLLPMQGTPRPVYSAHVPVPLHQMPAAGPHSPARGPPRMAGSCAAGCMRLGPALGGALGGPRPGDKWAAPARVRERLEDTQGSTATD